MGRMRERWEILETRDALVNRWINIKAEKVRLPDGTIVDDYYVNHIRPIVHVIARTPEGLLVLTRQYKHGMRDWVLEFPAGTAEDGEDVLEAAVRELREETGYQAPRLEKIAGLAASPTTVCGTRHVYFGGNAEKIAEPTPDVTEMIELELYSPAELREMALNGGIVDTSTIACVFLALNRLGELG